MPPKKKRSPEREINPETVGIGTWPTRRIIECRVAGTLRVHRALQSAIPELNTAAEIIVEWVQKGGRVVTIGAGASGVAGMSVMRELPQNHAGIDPAQFTWRIAGEVRVMEPFGCEDLEDNWKEGREEIVRMQITDADVVIGISATGHTPYTRGAVKRSREFGAFTIGLLCQPDTELEDEVGLAIVLDVGPEMFFGATSGKAASAQKEALDAIMAAVVVGLGITDDNRCNARLCHDTQPAFAKNS